MDREMVEYTTKTIISTLGLSPDIPLQYGLSETPNTISIFKETDRKKKGFGILRQKRNFRNIVLNEKIPLLGPCLSLIKGEKLVEYEDGGTALSIDSETNTIYFGFDILKSIFYFITLEQEKFVTKDEHGRILAKHCKEYPKLTVVNAYMKLIIDSLILLYKNMKKPLIQKWYWPDGYDFAVCLSHDIDWDRPDHLYPFLIPIIKLFRSKGNNFFKSLKTSYKIIFRSYNPWDLNQIIDIENKFQVKSSFFFLVNPRRKYLTRYRIEDIEGILRKLKILGFEIGYHSAVNDTLTMKKEKTSLEKLVGNVKGVRQHFLVIGPDTANSQKAAGFDYDSSFGYPDALGFRASFSFPYRIFDSKGEGILEIPPCMMDRTFVKYDPKSTIEAFKEFIALLEKVEKQHGLFTLIWHNNTFDADIYPGWNELYRKIIGHCLKKKVWIATAKEISDWWAMRDIIEIRELNHEIRGTRIYLKIYNFDLLPPNFFKDFKIEWTRDYIGLVGPITRTCMLSAEKVE